MEEVKLLKVTDDVTEVQVWKDGVFVGAGAYKNPVDIESAKQRIIEAWLM